jgi:F-type H+-transporting ATPase subunit b
MVLFLLLLAAYGLLVRRPLDRVLAERRARTTGAVEQAQQAIAAAEAETAVYETKLRAAKNEVYAARDSKLKQWAAEREAALGQARSATEEHIATARQEIEKGVVVAREQIETASGDLSAMILKAVLPPGVEATQ